MRQYLILLTVLLLPAFAQAQSVYSKGYPRFLASGKYHTDQTSGICFLGSQGGRSEFLLADDTGDLHRMFVRNDTDITFRHIEITGTAAEYLKDFPKQDFEEICYDKYTGKVYLSIEGNGSSPEKWVGIYELHFAGGNINSDTVDGIQKIEFTPREMFLEYIAPNIGYEGFTCDEKYFYLGLEGFQTGKDFADGTYIYIAEKSKLKIIAKLPTRKAGIHTICGLCAVGDGKMLVVDRNQRKLFLISVNPDSGITVLKNFELVPEIPGNPQLNYIAACESAAMDADSNIYVIDDPWKSHYVPGEPVFGSLDPVTQKNFKEFIPIIFKLKYENLKQE